MFNRVIMLGNLTRDIELRYLQSGTAVATTSIATNRKFKNQMGEPQEEVCFVDITFFGRTAEIANQYLGRGRKVLIEGRLKLDQWTDQNGNKRSKHSIVVENLQMVDSRGSQDSFQGQNQQVGNGYDNYANTQRQQNFTRSTQQQNSDFDSGFNTPQHNNNIQPTQETNTQNIPEIDIDDDEIPF